MRIDELPPVSSESPDEALARFGASADRSRTRWPQSLVSWDRRTFVKATLAAGMAAGLATLGLFPPVRKARANHLGSDGYQISESCHYGGYADSCADPCDISPICIHCCQTDSADHYYKWHKATGTYYRLRKDDCTSSPWDGWKWVVQACCGNCNNPKYRCHDGRYCSDGTLSTCTPTVCKWLSDCPGSC